MRANLSLVAALAAGSLWIAPMFGQGRAPREERGLYVHGAPSSFIGLGVAEVDAERAKALKLPEERGVEVKNVAENGPAEKAGIRVGDVVLDYNGERVQGMEQFVRMVKETPAGRAANLTIWRNGARQTVTVTIGARPGNTLGFNGREFRFDMPPIAPHIPDLPRPNMAWNSPVLGVETESLSAQLADYFGVKEGALVRSVGRNSAAERAGIKAGDVIVKVDGTTVANAREISGVLRSLRGSKRTVPVVVVRNRKEVTVNVTLSGEGQPARAVKASLERAEV